MKKIITLILAAIAAVTVVAGGCSGSTKTAETESTRSETGGLIVSEEPRESSPMKLAVARASEENAIAAQSADSYTVTATVTPSHATITDVSWALSFANPSSSWASGKNVSDYVELTAGVSSATVRCKAAFGEQIILTATAQGNPSLKANCTLDYVKRVESISVVGDRNPEIDGDDLFLTKSCILGVGTIEGVLTWSNKADVIMREDCFYSIQDSSYRSKFIDAAEAYTNGQFDDINGQYETDITEDEAVYINYWNFLSFESSFKGYSIGTEADNYLRAMLYEAMNGKTGTGYVSVQYTYTYNGVSYGSGYVNSPSFTFNIGSCYVEVSNLSLSSTSYLF